MIDIPKIRFDALASYCRSPLTAVLVTETRWLAFMDERILATVIRDTDGDFSGVILARDTKERYRCIDTTGLSASMDEATRATEQRVRQISPTLEQLRRQGDEHRAPVDFFRPVRARDRLNPSFLSLAENEGFSPARGVIEAMMRWYEDPDGNFVEQFQTTGFDSRVWELYLYAMLSESNYQLDRSDAVPDFAARGLTGAFFVEATTCNPPLGADGRPLPAPPTSTAEEQLAYVRDYLPIRFAGPLTAKLQKEYWELPHVKGTPLVLAIQDFHAPMSMTRSRSGLPNYLYGYHHRSTREEDGSLSIAPEKVRSHRWGSKEIESDFFSIPGAEHVSAVLFNSSATISKFNRLGVIAGFGSRQVKLTQSGLILNHDPAASEPTPFSRVISEGYNETWIEGLDVYHNPRALHPLDPAMLTGAAHYHLLPDGQIESRSPKWHPLTSVTAIEILPTDDI